MTETPTLMEPMLPEEGNKRLADLVSKGLLVSDTIKSPVRLGFPIDVVERWFPKLYPAV